MDPIVQGTLFGAIVYGICGDVLMSMPESLRQNRIHQTVIGGVGGGMGGWMASQILPNPNGVYVMVGSLMGAVVLSKFLGLV